MIPTLAFVALVVFQVLFASLSPVEGRWEISLVSAVTDCLLLGAFWRISAVRKAAEQARYRQANEVMQWVFDLTRTQQDRWKSMVVGLESMTAEDLAAVEGVQEVLELPPADDLPDPKKEPGRSVESMMDSTQAMILMNQNLTLNFDKVFESFLHTYQRLQVNQVDFRLNHFRLSESVEFMGQMGIQTNQYSERIVLEVLDSFREITEFSKDIGTDVMGRVRDLMDAHNPESLEAIRRGSAEIHDTMDHFFVDLGKATAFSQTAVTENLTQMHKVQEMAQAIGEFSESIRMISLNLNIQAARITQEGGTSASSKGFQVLATKLSEFSVRAGELARQQHDTIALASEVMARSGRAQMDQLSALTNEIPKIKAELDPFESVVRQAYSQFEKVVGTMDHLSSSISERLKGVIGKFQFQDLVRQEQLHIQAMFQHVRDRAEPAIGQSKTNDETLKLRAWNDLLHTFECLATTENERIVIREFRKSHPFLADEGECTDEPAGSVRLF